MQCLFEMKERIGDGGGAGVVAAAYCSWFGMIKERTISLAFRKHEGDVHVAPFEL